MTVGSIFKFIFPVVRRHSGNSEYLILKTSFFQFFKDSVCFIEDNPQTFFNSAFINDCFICSIRESGCTGYGIGKSSEEIPFVLPVYQIGL